MWILQSNCYRFQHKICIGSLLLYSTYQYNLQCLIPLSVFRLMVYCLQTIIVLSLTPLQAVSKYIQMVCKCHGLSGSCTLKTCWRKMSPIRDISTRIKLRFNGAAKVTISNDGAKLIPEGEQTIKAPVTEDLVYSMDSPDYCEPNKSLGSIGTARRVCDPNSIGIGGCDLLCCGRRYSTRQVEVTENCNCRFRWCCEVICQICNVTKYIHRCKGYK